MKAFALFLLFWLLFGFSHAQSPNHSLCLNGGVKRYFVQNHVPGAGYQWFLPGGGGIIVNQIADTAFIQWGNTPGIFPLYVISSLGNNCESDTGRYWIELKEKPLLEIVGPAAVCEGQFTQLQANGASPVIWNTGATTPNISFTALSSAAYWALGGQGDCLSDTAQFSLLVWPLPIPSFNPVPPIAEVPGNIFFENNSLNASQFFWQFGDGNTSTGLSPTHTYNDTGQYVVQLTAENPLGCSNSISYSYVEIKEPFIIFIPNAFSPNGDAVNPFFKPSLNWDIPYTLEIYNRWGNLVFSKTDKNAAWNGELMGKIMSDQVFTYQISYRHPVKKVLEIQRGKLLLIGG